MVVRIFILILITTSTLFTQEDSLSKLNFNFYSEIYYSYDFSNPANNEKPGFLYNHKKHNEVNVNLLIAKVTYTGLQTRSNLALMAGTYSQYNLINEADWAKFVFEANMGVKLYKGIWLDAGILPSHIGFESAVSADCWTITRSLLAENSPYFETGAKLSYSSDNEKIYLAALLLNGWQNVQKPDAVKNLSSGIQITFKPTPKTTINYSNFFGTVSTGISARYRHFHNFYLVNQSLKNTGFILGFDIGFQKEKNENHVWYTPVVIIRQTFNEKWSMAFRSEYYNDSQNVIFNPGNNTRFIMSGLSYNLDYDINSKVKIRLEAKNFRAEDKIFSHNTENNNLSITTSMSVKF